MQERTTTTATSEEILDGLNDLLQLDHDAIGAYDIAIEKLESPEYAQQIRGFRSDHERHIQGLNELIVQLGGTPANEPHATAPLKQALQNLGAKAGDKGVLIAFRANELQVRTKYDGYASKANRWPANVKETIDRNALDEERHYRWIAETLASLGVGSGEGAETHMANRARETMNRAGAAADRARERISEGAGSARLRAADGLDTAADRLDEVASRQEAAGGARAQAAQAGYRVADSLEVAADRLRYRSDGGGTDLQDLEERARENPLRAVLLTFTAGFVLGRLLR